MKKGSTAVTQRVGNISRQKLTIGLDLGDRNSWDCVVDEAGRIQLEQRVPTTAKGLREVFGAMACSRIALQTGTHSPWISRLLGVLGHEVIVANARKVRLMGESRKKDDRLDAQTLARLARIDPQLLCPVKHGSQQAQADLTLIRARAGLVRARTALVNTVRGLAKSYGERLRGCNVRNMNPEKAEGLSPELQSALQPLLAALESVSQQIHQYNQRIETLAQERYPQVDRRRFALWPCAPSLPAGPLPPGEPLKPLTEANATPHDPVQPDRHGWIVKTEAEKMDGRAKVLLSKFEEEGRGLLVVRCSQGETDVYVLTDHIVDTRNVRVKFYTEPPHPQNWSKAESGDALFSPEAINLARKLLRSFEVGNTHLG